MTTTQKRITGIGILVLLLTGLLLAASANAKTKVFTDNSGAIRGYDPVAYFTAGAAVKGSPEITHQYNGATWHFASEENRQLFVGNPDKYAPAYGGFCAFGLTKNKLVQTDPQAWTIYEGKLYLNYSIDVRSTWSKDIPGNLQISDTNWKELGQE